MNACFCGNPIGDGGILCDRCTALRVLELDSRATPQQIKATYRMMVKVWHPDRFQGDESLRWSAEQKLRNVNLAYKILTETPANAERRSKRARASVDPQDEHNSANSTSTTGLIPEPDAPAPLITWLRWTFSTFFKVCFAAFAILIVRYLWIAFDVPQLSSGVMHQAYDAGLDNVAKELEGPEQRLLDAVGHDLKWLGLKGPAAAVAAAEQSEQAAAHADENTEPASAEKTPNLQSSKTHATPKTIHPFITIGSTRDEVIAMQGHPTESSDDKLVYGHSELDLKDGSVVGWKISPESNPIRVKLWPEHSVDTSQTSFTVDSTRDDVLVVQGTPTAFSKDEFDYGTSAVYFRGNRVASWKNDPSSIPLRVRNP
jgi:hypothetical protein